MVNSSSSSLLLKLMVLTLMVSTGTVHGVGEELQQPTFSIYLFEQFVSVPGAEATNIVSAAPDGNFSLFLFGNMGVSQQLIRESASNTSKIIGRAPGWFAPNKEHGIFNLQKLVTLRTEKYNGTFVVFAEFDTNFPTNEYAIVGGTGSFRLTSGWITTSIASAGWDHLTYKWDVFLHSKL